MTAPVRFPALTGREPCRTGDPDRFHPERGDWRAIRAAKAECAPCPARAECLNWALNYGESGVWGGTSDQERKDLRRALGIRKQVISTYLVDHEQVVRMARRGMSIEQIAERLDCSMSSVRRILNERRAS